MKGALLSKSPLEDLTLTILTRVVQASSSGELTTFVGLEYFPHGKINSVPADATPYRRDLTGGVAIIVSWDDDTPEKSKRAAKEAREIASLIGPEGEGYGNYGDGSYGAFLEAFGVDFLMKALIQYLAYMLQAPTAMLLRWKGQCPLARLKHSLAVATRECRRSKRNMTRIWFSTSGL